MKQKRPFAKYLPYLLAGVTLVALPADAQRADPVLDAAAEAAAAFVASLPDYIVERVTTRYLGNRAAPLSPAESVARWEMRDVVTAELVSEHGSEAYTNVTVNRKPVKKLPAGAQSSGEFSFQAVGILAPASAAQFTHERKESIRDHPSYRYDYAIDQAHSTWRFAAQHLRGGAAPVSYSTAYSGEIWIDRKIGQVIRIQMLARDVPASFPLDSIESATDYDLVKIGEGTWLLPTHSEALTCQRGGHDCWKNETVFQGYNKFAATSSITFDGAEK